MPLLPLPTLRVLWLTEVAELKREEGVVFPWEDAETLIEFPLGTCGVEDMSMDSSYISTEKLVKLLDAIRSLKSFSYWHVKVWVEGEDESEDVGMKYAPVAVALERHKETLEQFQFPDDNRSTIYSLAELAELVQDGCVKY